MAVAGPPNPISVPVVDDEYAWDQIADVVTDYFKIAREQRARRGAEGACEGRIDTVPRDSATWLEPHRNDSIGTWNRWESTFQTIRRRATVRVIPDANGYLVEVIVEKEREDLPKPERSTVSRASFSDNIDFTLPSDRLEEPAHVHSSPRWLSLGRDPALEHACSPKFTPVSTALPPAAQSSGNSSNQRGFRSWIRKNPVLNRDGRTLATSATKIDFDPCSNEPRQPLSSESLTPQLASHSSRHPPSQPAAST